MHVWLDNCRRVSPWLSHFRSICSVRYGMKHFNHQIPERQREYRPCVDLHREKMISASVELCEPEVCFLAHPTCWHKRVTSENAEFLVMLILSLHSCTIRVLKESKSALLCCVSHITILPVFTCMMNVRDQTRQAFVTRICPFCDRTSKFVHRPHNIMSPNTSQIQTFQNNL